MLAKASVPFALIKESGSWSLGKNKNCAETPSLSAGSADSKARQAAFWPALSPSKQKTTSGTLLKIRSICVVLVAVPSVATANVNPA